MPIKNVREKLRKDCDFEPCHHLPELSISFFTQYLGLVS